MSKRISVHVRIKDGGTDEETAWIIKDNTLYQIIDRTTHLSYSCYQNVYINTSTEEIYQVVQGINSTIFAYGQTGSGKTYTMLGDDTHPGLVKLSILDIFQIRGGKSLEVSYLEIYNEMINDLIDERKDIKMYTVDNKPVVSGLTRVRINRVEDVLRIVRESEGRRKTGYTEYNERSSRSHTIFQVHMIDKERGSTLSLIDLAGSERASGGKDRRKESAYINKSLLALGTVVNRLIRNEFVNYRDS
jgi:centromeric protein E